MKSKCKKKHRIKLQEIKDFPIPTDFEDLETKIKAVLYKSSSLCDENDYQTLVKNLKRLESLMVLNINTLYSFDVALKMIHGIMTSFYKIKPDKTKVDFLVLKNSLNEWLFHSRVIIAPKDYSAPIFDQILEDFEQLYKSFYSSKQISRSYFLPAVNKFLYILKDQLTYKQ